ncbi:hypothetical protein EV13_1390 [Prochlorococcus sp. MIT 0702]|nr:hypothetical protein EV12_1412 [Prochlorococcus sp. MIT 0701]KGG28877.1 hypothetical protein EV13_1390 [Prochlorococcus sp. MIT 0702]KGG37191.1 hypothetical protein EV14_0134 [Prochlorococcus sp. MIT 0703]
MDPSSSAPWMQTKGLNQLPKADFTAQLVGTLNHRGNKGKG